MHRHSPGLRNYRLQFRETSRGFTLVELLVVVGIIAILVALSLAAYAKAINFAREGACMGNMRMFGAAVLTGIADHNGMLVPPIQGGDIDCESFVTPYLNGSTPICPVWRSTHPLGAAPYGGLSYAIDLNIPWFFPRISSIPFPPDRVVLASESYSGDFFSLGIELNSCMYGTSNAYYSAAELQSHEGEAAPPQFHGAPNHRGLNLFMLDGSVHFISPDTESWESPSQTYGTRENDGYYYDTSQFESPNL
jgi:prepilin-type N-terminal cleavage/methylation domain-containing protein